MRRVVGPVLLLAGIGTVAFAEDGVTLLVNPGFTPAEVRLDWSGGQPVYFVYRSTDPAAIVSPPNKLGETSGAVWLDTPPAGTLFYYRIVGPCMTPSLERCDGVDDDCDGLIDNGCPGSCVDDLGCLPGEYCDATGRCAADRPDGQACSRPEQCAANHCSNGTCCSGGDCCTSAGECASHGWPTRCDAPASCQGTSAVGTCTAAFQCASIMTGDDSGCAGLLSRECGPYPSLFCTSDPIQPVDQAALCPDSCVDDAGCDPGAHCDADQCVFDLGPGQACDESSDCQSTFCVDGVCCDNGCTGTCRACDLAGSVGTCAPVPDGSDPDLECGGVSCASFYWGWIGDSCRRKADVPASAATCGGAGACRTQAAECTAQTAAGTTALTCHATCQSPNPSTCTGTTAGDCIDLNPGTQSCGVGPCLNVVNQCSGGSPLVCTPLPPNPETCNNIDDNCNSVVDDGLPGDAFESNNTCGTLRTLPTVGSDQTNTLNTMTIYPSGDVDYFRINATETDSSCACCDAFCTDEDYTLRVTLTVPAGAGSYELCLYPATCGVAPTCLNVAQGTSGSLSMGLDGNCLTADAYAVFVRVDPGTTAPGFECLPYTLSYFFDAFVCH